MTNTTVELKKATILVATKNIEDAILENSYSKITNITSDGIVIELNGSLNTNGNFWESGHWFSRQEILSSFKIINSLEDIENLEYKASILKETLEQNKIMLGDDISDDEILKEAIEFLVNDEFKGDAIELQFIYDNMDLEQVEKCSCCGKILMPDDECYSDELHDDAVLCDHCSVFNEETDMYKKVVNQDVIEQLTGLKFSPHIGNVDSKIEEFNYWLNRENYLFDYKQTDNRDTLVEFINEYTDWNICDCCGLIELSTDLIWDSEEVWDEDYQNFRFLKATAIPTEAVCEVCMNKAGEISKFSLEDLTARLKQNGLLFRESDKVLIENFDFQENNIKLTTYFGTIKSINIDNKTYTLEEYEDIEFKDEDFYDILNEAYLMEYGDFISDNHSDLSDKVDEWTSPNWEGIAEIDYAFEEFGYKEEFIEHLKSKNLPYGRFLEPKYNIGDSFRVSFPYYEDGETTEHIISKIDKSFNEADEIVYWDDNSVYITESELEKQKLTPNVIELIKCGMNRIEFSNALQDLIIGNNEDGNDLFFKDLNIDEKIYYLQAIIEDYKEI